MQDTLLPLTYAQRGLWFGQQLDPQNPAYNIAQYLDLRGTVDGDLVAKAFEQAVGEAEALRLQFHETEDGPRQSVGEPGEFAIRSVDLCDEPDPEQAAHDRMARDRNTAWLPGSDDLLSVVLFRCADDHHILYQRVHHLMIDGYAAVLVLQRVRDVYNNLLAGEPVSATPFGSLVDVLADEDAYRNNERSAADAAFWRAELAEVPDDAARLAGRPQRLPHRLLRATGALSEESVRNLSGTLRDAKLPASIGFLTAAALYLHRMTGSTVVSLGLPVTARRTDIARRTPSMLSNIVPVIVSVRPDMTVGELALGVAAKTRDVLRHQRYRYESLRATTASDRTDRVVGPQLNILPVVDDLTFGDVQARMHNLSIGPVEDLSLLVNGLRAGEDVPIDLDGNPDLYSDDDLQRHLERLTALLDALPGRLLDRVGNIELVGAQERIDALDAGRGQHVAHDSVTVVDELLLRAQVIPDETAVVAADGQRTFAELNVLSNRLAHLLHRRGVQPHDVVAVRMPRSVRLIGTIVGILKSGAAYLPLDPAYPAERLERMTQSAHPALTLVCTETATGAADELVIDSAETQRLIGEESDELPTTLPGTDDLAYVLYTSGSTGLPKGVAVEHGSLANLLRSHQRAIFAPARQRLGRSLRVAHTAGTSFDASWDPLLWMVDGHELHLVADDVRRDSEALVEHVRRDGIDAIETTPSYAKVLLDGGLSDGSAGPTVIALGGEAVDSELWRRLADLDHVHAYNFYGPTETTVDSLIAEITPQTTPTIGRSVANSRHYVLDPGLQPTPPNTVGELYIAGPNLARGYLGRSELSAERFVADPFVADGGRMYRTGDVVRRDRGGRVEFVGRADDQVKVRGFRVELGEIEAALKTCAGVRLAVADVHASADRVVAWVVPDEAALTTVDPAAVIAATARLLPDYMVPAAVMVIEHLPMTVNGKLDRSALPAPAVGAGRGRRPTSRLERTLAALFEQVLDADDVGADQDFFELGGHSLTATKLVARIRAESVGDLSIRDVFEHPTVALLAQRLADTSDTRPELVPQQRPEVLPLSDAQRRLWFLNRYEPGSGAYNIPIALELDGSLDVEALRVALHDVVTRHETLRTIFPWDGEQPRQQILPSEDVPADLTASRVDRSELMPRLRAEAARGFDVTREPPLRPSLLRLDQKHHVLLLVLHHIAGDGWSLGPLARDLAAAYRARVSPDDEINLPDLGVQYADYTLWQQEVLGDDTDPHSRAASQLRFWRGALSDLPVELTLPTDRPRPGNGADADSVSQTEGSAGMVTFDLPGEVADSLRQLAGRHHASLYMVVQAAVAALLTRHGAGTDIPVGTPVAGRDDAAVAELVGFFANTLVLRTDTSGEPTFDEIVDRVRQVNVQAYANADVAFERVVEELSPPRSSRRHPLFQVMLTVQDAADPELSLPALNVKRVPEVGPRDAKFDLLFHLHDTGDGLSGSVEFDRALFDDPTAQLLADRLSRMMTAVAATPTTPLHDIAILDVAEEQMLHARPELRPVGRTVVDAFAAHARQAPDSVAVVAGGTRFTFAELDLRTDALASSLAARGIGTGDVVAALVPRSVDTVIALLATLKAGAAYLPLDPAYPAERIDYMLADSSPRAVLTRGRDLNAPQGCVVVDLDDEPLVPSVDTPVPVRPGPDDAAYVIYTSGSTGRPKGVMVGHRALANVFDSHCSSLIGPAVGRVRRPVRVAHTAGVSFDASWDPILWMIAGQELHVVGDDIRTDAEALVAHLRSQQIDVVETTPSYAHAMIAAGLFDDGLVRASEHAGLSVLLLGGEAIDAELWDRLRREPGLVAHNLYGPTEFTVDSLSAALSSSNEPVIGTPIDGVGTLVLDDRLRAVPTAVVGELYLTGVGAAIGYLGRADLTAERFVADPGAVDGARMYRTGDLVSRRTDGTLRFVGRVDDQLKLRGFRIEPGEIETVLVGHPQVSRAVVDVRGADRLVGYAVSDADPVTLQGYLSARLPTHMVPSAVVTLDRLPLTPNGKVDKAALPEPDLGSADGRAPRTDEERVLCDIVADLLAVRTVSIDDDFFALGGHSLLAVRLIGRIREALGRELQVRTVFTSPTVAGMAAALGNGRTDHPRLEPRQSAEPAPLSYAQSRLWFLNRVNPSAADYNIVSALRLHGPLDRDALQSAFADVVAHHEVLRTVYPERGGEARQMVLPADDAGPDLVLEHADGADRVDAVVRRVASEGFDLVRETPLRTVLVEVAPQEHVLVVALHHIAGDGWSSAVLTRELSTAYTARMAARGGGVGTVSAARAALPVQYADYAVWQRSVLGSPDDPNSRMTTGLRDWAAALADAPEESGLPADRQRPAEAVQPADTMQVELDADLHGALQEFGTEHGVSMFMLLHAGLAAVLTRVGAGEDICIGSPTAGRTDPALDDLVGFFVNTLAVRTDTSGDPSFGELVDRVRETVLAAFERDDVPFEQVVERLAPSRVLGRHPLVQTMLTLNNNAPVRLDLPGLAVDVEPEMSTGAAKFDLSLSLGEQPDGRLAGTVEFNSAIYDSATVRALIDRLDLLLRGAVRDSTTRLSQLPVVDAAERDRVLRAGRGPELTADDTLDSVVAVFERQAGATPQALAIEADGMTLTFAELENRSRAVAVALRRRGVGVEDVVGVVLPRSLDTAAVLLGVLRSGAAYLPIDTDNPDERIASVIREAGPKVVIAADADRFGIDGAITPDELLRDGIDSSPLDLPAPHGDDLAYVIYTSGSTGRPKGVEVEHRSLLNLFLSHREQFYEPQRTAAGRALRVAHTAGVAFDAAWDPVLWMFAGHTMHVVTGDVRRDAEALASHLRELRIDVVETTPSFARLLLDVGCFRPGGPGVLALGGEAVDRQLWTELRAVDHLQAYNFYGPTEVTVDSVIAALADGRDPVLGCALANTSAHVLDERFELAPTGAVGELCLAGAGVARGYRKRPDLTAQQFVADPFGGPGSRMYRTGDLVRRRHDGALTFVGRTDDQVKIRGFRVELGEVRSVLSRHPAVRDVAVVVDRRPGGDQLAAYLVPSVPGQPLGRGDLVTHLTADLPDYMVPSTFTVIGSLPLTINGKLDVAALPEPDRSSGSGPGARTPREIEMCRVFAEVVGLDEVALEDNFFEIGGHSLLAAWLVAETNRRLGGEVGIQALFRAPTPAAFLSQVDAGEPDDGLQRVLPVRSTGSRAPLFCVHAASGIAWKYAGLLAVLDADQPVFALQAQGVDGTHGALPGTLTELADEYIGHIRSVRSKGPYRLLGFSFGGNLAHAIAARLQDLGETVEQLIVLDAYPTGQETNASFDGPGGLWAAFLDTMNIHPDPDEVADLGLDRVRSLMAEAQHPMADLDADVFRALADTFDHTARLLRETPAPRFDGDLLLFRADEDRPAGAPDSDSWVAHITGDIEVIGVPVRHSDLLEPAALTRIGPVLDQRLAGISSAGAATREEHTR